MAAASNLQQGLRQLMGLYRSILRLHRERLPGEMRQLGDSYVRSEFLAHLRGKTDQAQWVEFVKQWQGYVVMLRGPAASSSISSPFTAGSSTPEDLEALAESTGHMAQRLDEYLTAEQRLRMDALKREASMLGQQMMGSVQQHDIGSMEGGEPRAPKQG